MTDQTPPDEVTIQIAEMNARQKSLDSKLSAIKAWLKQFPKDGRLPSHTSEESLRMQLDAVIGIGESANEELEMLLSLFRNSKYNPNLPALNRHV